MSIAHETNAKTERPPIISRRTPEEQRERNARAMKMLEELAADPDIDDQRETLAVLREAGLVAPEGGYQP